METITEGMGKLVYSDRDLEEASNEILERIDKAVLATAFNVRDNMRSEFKNSKSNYKYSTEKYNELSEGIMVGKLRNGTVKVHALGSPSKYNTYKTRFFVGGTIYRTQTERNGVGIKPSNKGYLKSNDAVEKGLKGGQETLERYINNVLKK